MLEYRECYACGSNKTFIEKTKKGTLYPKWYSNHIENQWLCSKCYSRLITAHKWSHIISKKWNPITNKKWNPRRLNFTLIGKSISLEENPRIGVCNHCRAVKGVDCKKTDMHHERYDETNPLRYAIELCASCHCKETNKRQQAGRQQ